MSYSPSEIDRQNVVDAEHLRLLAIFHYIGGGLIILLSSLFIFHIVIGLAMAGDPKGPGKMFFPFPEKAQSAPRALRAEVEPGDASSERQPSPDPSPEPPHERSDVPDFGPFGSNVGYIFAAMGTFMVVAGWTTGILVIVSGISLHRRRRRVFSLVIAGLSCCFFPFGTALGVFTFIVLMRPSVERLYRSASTLPPPLPA